MRSTGILVLAFILSTFASAEASPWVNGCRSQAECDESRCCIFDWIPGVETSIGLCVEPSTSGSICSPSCPRPSCADGLECVADKVDSDGRLHICQWRPILEELSQDHVCCYIVLFSWTQNLHRIREPQSDVLFKFIVDESIECLCRRKNKWIPLRCHLM